MEHCLKEPCISVKIGKKNYRTEIRANGHVIVSDEPPELGGNNEGMDPVLLLLASLGSCTAITLRMYADRKKWPLEEVRIDLSMDVVKSEFQQTSYIKKHLHFQGPLTDEQKERLVQIADHCPVDRILSNPVVITNNAV